MTAPPRNSMPAKVVVVGQQPPPVHGSNLVCEELINSLEGAGIRVIFVEKRFSERIEEVGKANFGKMLRVPKFLAHALRECPSGDTPVVYFVSLTPASFLVDALCIQMLTRGRRVPLILYVHGVGFRALSAGGVFMSDLVRRTLRSSDAVVSLTDSLQQDVEPWTDPSQRHVIANPVPGNDAPPSPLPVGVNFLFLSNLVLEKGPDTFLRAASLVACKDPHATFTLAGAAYDASASAEVQRLAGDRALRGRLQLFGPAKPEEKRGLFASCSLLVFPSRYKHEAAPLTILEAKRAGRGVLASDVGGIKDLVRPGIDGMLLDSGDAEAWSEAMLAITRSPDTAGAWGHAARSDYESRFTDKVFDADWLKLLRDFGPAVPLW